MMPFIYDLFVMQGSYFIFIFLYSLDLFLNDLKFLKLYIFVFPIMSRSHIIAALIYFKIYFAQYPEAHLRLHAVYKDKIFLTTTPVEK